MYTFIHVHIHYVYMYLFFQIITEQLEHLRCAQSQIKDLEVEHSTLCSSLESVQAELSHCQKKKIEFQTRLEQARRENRHFQRWASVTHTCTCIYMYIMNPSCTMLHVHVFEYYQ